MEVASLDFCKKTRKTGAVLQGQSALMVHSKATEMVGLVVFLLVLGGLLLAKVLDRAPPPIFGVYSRPSGLYWPKALLLWALLSLKQVCQRLSPHRPDYYQALDGVQPLPATPMAADAVYFNATNQRGECLFVGTARRPHRLVDAFLYLKLDEVGMLELPQLPDSAHFNRGAELSYQAAGIHIESLEPMRRWRLDFQGQLREAGSEGRVHDVTIEAVYTSDEPFFNYATQLHPWSMAKGLALEKWSRAYFANVRRAHQLHYEQFGVLEGLVRVGGTEYPIRLDAMRDHSLAAHRDWASFRRYALHWLTAANGDHVAIGVICQPISYSRLQFGYVFRARDRRMCPITSSDLHLHHYGEQGAPPLDYGFTFMAGGCAYDVQVNVLATPHFYISKRWEAKVYECQCRAQVNGLEAWGGVEWQYRHVAGRPAGTEF